MLECIKFGDCKIKTIQTEEKWFVYVRHIGIESGVGPDTLKGMAHYHLPQQYTFSIKEVNIDDSYDGCKLFTTISSACRIIVGSTHPGRHDVIDFLVERHNYLQDQAWKA